MQYCSTYIILHVDLPRNARDCQIVLQTRESIGKLCDGAQGYIHKWDIDLGVGNDRINVKTTVGLVQTCCVLCDK